MSETCATKQVAPRANEVPLGRCGYLVVVRFIPYNFASEALAECSSIYSTVQSVVDNVRGNQEQQPGLSPPNQSTHLISACV